MTASKAGGELFHNTDVVKAGAIASVNYQQRDFFSSTSNDFGQKSAGCTDFLVRPGNWKFMKLGEKQFKICLVVFFVDYFRTYGFW